MAWAGYWRSSIEREGSRIRGRAVRSPFFHRVENRFKRRRTRRRVTVMQRNFQAIRKLHFVRDHAAGGGGVIVVSIHGGGPFRPSDGESITQFPFGAGRSRPVS